MKELEDFEIEMLKKIEDEKLTEDDRSSLVWGMDEVDVIVGDDHRWEREMITIFKIGDRHFSIKWMSGLTECQEDSFYNDPVEVKKITETVTKEITIWEYI